MNHWTWKEQQRIKREQKTIDGVIAAVIIIVLALVMLALLAVPARAEELNTETFFAIAKLNDTQKMFYLGLLSAVDYRQTVNTVVKHPDRYCEMNPILGPHPDRRSLALFGMVGLGAVYAAQHTLPEFISRILVDSIIASEQVNVWENQYAISRNASIPVMIVVSYSF